MYKHQLFILHYYDIFSAYYNGADVTEIDPYFNNNQANMANEAFYNGDSKYKYINPARYGYHDDLYDKPIAAGAGPYLYAA